jgi:hypothetical protein
VTAQPTGAAAVIAAKSFTALLGMIALLFGALWMGM